MIDGKKKPGQVPLAAFICCHNNNSCKWEHVCMYTGATYFRQSNSGVVSSYANSFYVTIMKRPAKTTKHEIYLLSFKALV